MAKPLIEHQLNDKFDGFLLIKRVVKGTTANGSAFLTVTLADKTREIDAKLWNVSPIEIERYPEGTILIVSGIVGEYNNKPQLTIHNVDVANASDPITVADLMPSAPIAQDALEAKIRGTANSLDTPDIKTMVWTFIDRYTDELFTYPAATSMHHAYKSGLAHHICGMLDIGEAMCKIHPAINRDLLLAGIILHDIGKIHEYESVEKPVFTLKGALLGHISIMMAEMEGVAKDFGLESDAVMLLQHMILSHHGKGEWGSPKKPVILEAEVLHNIDMMDANLNALGKALGNTKPGEFTERIFALDGRSFYNHSFKSE